MTGETVMRVEIDDMKEHLIQSIKDCEDYDDLSEIENFTIEIKGEDFKIDKDGNRVPINS